MIYSIKSYRRGRERMEIYPKKGRNIKHLLILSVKSSSINTNHCLILSFSIRIAGFGEVVVPVKYLCDCDCSINNVKNSPKCNGAGTFECGICKCNEGNYGATCQCDITTEQQVNNTNACIGSDNTTTCSDQGNCVCGQCECFKQTVSRIELIL